MTFCKTGCLKYNLNIIMYMVVMVSVFENRTRVIGFDSRVEPKKVNRNALCQILGV